MLTDTGGTYPWCVAQAFKPGDLPFGTQLDGVQLAVKSKWPDGSAKIAVLASVTVASGTSHSVVLGAGTAPAGTTLTTTSLKATGITTAIGTDKYGSASWSGTDWDSPFVNWVSGPVMSSWIYRKDIGSDAHLTAWLEVRLWATGHVEVLPWIENGYLLKAAPGGRPGDYTFTLNGTERFRMTLPVYHHTRAPLISGATLSYWVGGDKKVVPKHDRRYLYGTGLVQTYMANVEREWWALPTSQGVSGSFKPYEPFTANNSLHSTNMGQGGGHVYIGVQPGWEAVALIDSVSALAHEQMIRESYRFGAHQIHYRDENTKRALAFSAHPNTALRLQAEVAYSSDSYAPSNISDINGGGPGPFTPVIADGWGDQWNRFDSAHAPASPLLAYLTTGRWWFMDECQHHAAIHYLMNQPMRNGSAGIYDPAYPSVQLRRCAWSLRDLFIASCVTPDDDVLKAEFDGSIAANAAYYHTKYVNPGFSSAAFNQFGLIQADPVHGGNQAFMYDYWAASWAKAVMFRVGGTTDTRKKVRQFMDWCSKSVVGRIGSTASTDFLYRWATTGGPYTELPGEAVPDTFLTPADFTGHNEVAPTYRPDYAGGTGPWWPNWGAYFEWKIRTRDGYSASAWPKVDGKLGGYGWLDTTGRWSDLMKSLTALASLRAPGALEALNRLKAAVNWSEWTDALAYYNVPANALDATALPLEDFDSVVPGVGMRANVNANSASDVDYDATGGLSIGQRWWNGYGATNSFSSMVFSYSGTVWAAEYGAAGAMILHGGGHGGQIGAFSYLFDVSTRRWRQVGAPRNVPPTSAWCGWADAKAFGSYSAALDQRDPAWMDYNYNGSYIKFSDHEYMQNAYIAPSEGGGPSGSLLLPQSTFSQDPGVADPRTGVSYRWAPHLMAMSDGTMTRATAAPLGAWGAYSQTVSVKVPARAGRPARLWYFHGGQTVASYHELNGSVPLTRQTHQVQKASGGNATDAWSIYNTSWLYVPEADALIYFTPTDTTLTLNHPVQFRLFSMANGFPVDLQRTDLPTRNFAHGGVFVGAAWCPTLRKFYIYEGFGDTYCTVLTPSSLNFATCTWTWSKEEFGGAPPVTKLVGAEDPSNAQTMSAQGKFVWVPAYGCFAWHDGPTTSGVCVDGVTRDGIVQLWRPPGAPA